MSYFLFFLADILLGFVPQAAGCAVCLFTITNLSLHSGKFWATTGIFSAIAIIIRTAYNIKLLDFGFHTIVIWSMFILVAIGFNRLPAMSSIVSILISGIVITLTEVITAGVLILIYGNENFDRIMNNTATLQGKTVKAACGIPANILFVILMVGFYFLKRAWRKRREAEAAAAIPAEAGEPQETPQEY